GEGAEADHPGVREEGPPRHLRRLPAERSRQDDRGPVQRAADPPRAGERAAAVGRDRGARSARRVHDREPPRTARDRGRSAFARAEARAEDPAEDIRASGWKGRSPCEEQDDRKEGHGQTQVTCAVLAPGYGGTAEQPLL